MPRKDGRQSPSRCAIIKKVLADPKAGVIRLTLALMIVFSFEADAEEWFPLDESAKLSFSLRAASASDYTMSAAHIMSLHSNMKIKDSGLRGKAFEQFFLAEILNYYATSAVKSWASRNRPYFHNPSTGARAYAKKNPSDVGRSFYSGHASTSFVAAYSTVKSQHGQFENDQKKELILASFFMAASTARLRVVAGKHYYSDVMVGAFAGVLTTELAHTLVGGKGRFSEVEDSDYNYMAAGLVLGAVWPSFFDWSEESTVTPTAGEQGLGLRYATRW
jgi:membrane-associated phospholipid phosphatase